MGENRRIPIVAVLFHSLVAGTLFATRTGSLPLLWWGLALSWIAVWVLMVWLAVFDRLTGRRTPPSALGERRLTILCWAFSFLVMTVFLMAAGIVLN